MTNVLAKVEVTVGECCIMSSTVLEEEIVLKISIQLSALIVYFGKPQNNCGLTRRHLSHTIHA